MKFIVTFDDVAGSLQTEQVLKRRGVSCVIDTAPRSLGASCGYIIRAEAQNREALAAVLGDAPIRWADILPEEPGKERGFDGADPPQA
ncbi:MAG: DUF3343 domain-containing protein [Treponema sp.]|nr:DUF3343 domain-containing protein [Treponema sp.]